MRTWYCEIAEPTPKPAYTVVAYESYFSQVLVNEMDKAMKCVYPNGEIVVTLGCPHEFYLWLTADWTTFVPQMPKPGFQFYSKCMSLPLLVKTLPGVTVSKSIERQGTVYWTYLQATITSPVRVMYNVKRQALALSFYHQPLEEDVKNWHPAIKVERQKAIARPGTGLTP